MPQEDESLKAEMAAQLRADWERARERRKSDPPAEPEREEQVPGTKGAWHQRLLKKR